MTTRADAVNLATNVLDGSNPSEFGFVSLARAVLDMDAEMREWRKLLEECGVILFSAFNKSEIEDALVINGLIKRIDVALNRTVAQQEPALTGQVVVGSSASASPAVATAQSPSAEPAKWCHHCKKDTHNDAECWSTRIGPSPASGTDAPRTEAFLMSWKIDGPESIANFARRLERELAEARRENEQLNVANKQLFEQGQRMFCDKGFLQREIEAVIDEMGPIVGSPERLADPAHIERMNVSRRRAAEKYCKAMLAASTQANLLI